MAVSRDGRYDWASRLGYELLRCGSDFPQEGFGNSPHRYNPAGKPVRGWGSHCYWQGQVCSPPV